MEARLTDKELHEYINNTPALLSLLSDINFLPEQTLHNHRLHLKTLMIADAWYKQQEGMVGVPFGERPTKEGYYWVQSMVHAAGPQIVQIYSPPKGTKPEQGLVVNEGMPWTQLKNEIYDHCSWLGPIPDPSGIAMMAGNEGWQ